MSQDLMNALYGSAQNANSMQNMNQLGQQQHIQQQHIPQGLYVPPPPPPPKLVLTPTKPPEKKSMFKEITTDIKAFVLEHRGVIYFIAAALILDHFFFRGAFKARLQSMADKVVTKVEEKIK